MAIKRYAGDKYFGLSSHTKPTNVRDGAVFFEGDTLSIYLKEDGIWKLTAEPAFEKNTGFNKNFGTGSDNVTVGNDGRLSNSREWTATTVTQAEAETGTATTRRAWTSQRVRQAIASWWSGIKDDFKTEVRQVETTTKTAAWTLSLSEGDYYRYTGASNVNATVPNNTSVAYPIGTVITIWQQSTGQVTANPASGVTINGDTKTADQHKAIQLVKIDTNIWDCVGGVE